MSEQNREAAPEQDSTLSSKTRCAFADELFRLAEDIKNIVIDPDVSPRFLSNLTAMKPIISLLWDEVYSTILNTGDKSDLTQPDHTAPTRGVSPAGYL